MPCVGLRNPAPADSAFAGHSRRIGHTATLSRWHQPGTRLLVVASPGAASEFASPPADSADNADSSPISAGKPTFDPTTSHVSTTADSADMADEHAEVVSPVSMGADSIATRPAPVLNCENPDPVSVVSTVSGGSATNQPPAGPVVSEIRQQARSDLTRGRRDPQRGEPDHDPDQEALLGDDTASCRDCHKPAAQWVLASRDGRCITCHQHARKEAS